MIHGLFNCESYYLSWHDTTGLNGNPFSSSHDDACDDSFYLTYTDDDGRPRYTNLGYGGNGLTPYLFGDYTFYLEENEAYRGYGSNMEVEDNTLYHQGYGYGNYFGDSNSKQQDYLENQQCGFCLGGNSWDSIFHNLENLQNSRSWDDWEMEETVLCQRMFGY